MVSSFLISITELGIGADGMIFPAFASKSIGSVGLGGPDLVDERTGCRGNTVVISGLHNVLVVAVDLLALAVLVAESEEVVVV